METLYRSERNYWLEGPLFKNYLTKIWFPAVLKPTSAKVVMICENCSAYGNSLTDIEGVEYEFIPPRVTSIYQTMDQGIIEPVKRYQRASLLKNNNDVMPKREEIRVVGRMQRAGTVGFKYGFGACSAGD